MKLNELAKQLNDLVDAGLGECAIGAMVLKPSPTKHAPYVEDYQITEVYDEAIEVGSISIVAREYEPLPPPSDTKGMMLP